MLEFGPDDVDAVLDRLGCGRQHAGIGLEVRIVRAERQDLHLGVLDEGDAQIVERHDLADKFGMHLGKIHRGVAAIGMADQGQVVIVRIGLPLLQLAQHEQNIGFAFLVDAGAAHIRLARYRHQRRIGRIVLLDAGHKIAARGKHVGKERVLGVLDRVAVRDDRDRKLPEAFIGLELIVATHREVDCNRPLP